jgi:uncharacterized protein (TIGR02246 family)
MTRLVNSITSAEEIRRLVQELYAAWSLHQLEKLDAIFTRDAAYEDVAAGQVHRSAEEIKQLLRATYAWAPDFRVIMKSLIVADDCAATEWVSEASKPARLAIFPQVVIASACAASPSSPIAMAK